MKKKILSSFLCICMVLVMMPIMAFAEGESPTTTPAPVFTNDAAYIFAANENLGAGNISATPGTTYILDWDINLVMHKEDNSQTLDSISYQVENEESVTLTNENDYTISPDKMIVTFTNARIKEIVGDVGVSKNVTFTFAYSGGSTSETREITINIRQSVDERRFEVTPTWQKGSIDGLDFTVHGQREQFVDARVNGELLERGRDYTLPPITTSGDNSDNHGFVVTLTPTYLNTLEDGTYSIEMLFNKNQKLAKGRAFVAPTPFANSIQQGDWTEHEIGTFMVIGSSGGYYPYIPPTPEPVIPPVEPVVPPVEPPEPTPEPVTPDKPKHDSNTPQTGDESNMWIWLSLFGIAGVGLGSLLAVKRRKI